MRAALAVLLALIPARVVAAPDTRPPEMPSRALPSRAPGAAELGAHAQRVADHLAKLLGVHERGDSAPADEGEPLRAALDLHAQGRLDEAADSFDLALTRGARRPHAVADPAAFVSAHLARAAIALARGEDKLAETLLARAMAYDPTLTLTPAEDSPTLRRTFDRVRQRLGATPDLAPADLGEGCDGGLVVARLVADGIELRRYDDCKLVATVVAPATRSAAEIARALAGDDVVAVAPPVKPFSPPPPREHFYQRAWFWIAVGGVVAASAGTAYWFLRDDQPSDQLEVMTHF